MRAARNHSHRNVQGGQAGGACDGLSIGETKRVLSLYSDGDFAECPELVKVTVSYRQQPRVDTAFANRCEIVGICRFATGKSDHAGELEFDIPARGTSIVVPGADFLELDARMDGAANTTAIVRVNGQASYGAQPSPTPATRTTTTTLPGESGTIVQIPAFARAVRPSISAARMAENSRLEFVESSAGAVVIAETVIDEGGIFPVPIGATHFRIIEATNVMVARLVWELGL